MVACSWCTARYSGTARRVTTICPTGAASRLQEGGALFTQCSHFVDLLIHFFGDVKSVNSVGDTKNHDIEIEDCGSAIMQFQSGVLGSMTYTTCTHRKNYEGSITIIGEKGTIKIGGQYLNTIDFWDVQDHPLPENVEFTDKPNQYRRIPDRLRITTRSSRT